MAKKVLIVDDSATVRQQVSAALAQAGFEVLEAIDGMDGAEKIAKCPDLALVITDMNMPRWNGLEMLQHVKADGKKAALPVVVLTTEHHPELIEQAKRFGAKGWIVKPFQAHLLIAAAQKLTKN